jgi:hypothetical protein
VDSNFPPGIPLLHTLSTANLDSVSGQNWTGLTTTDWIGGDEGAAELVAVRAVADPYRTNIFVYGNSFLRIPRDSGMAGIKTQWPQHLASPSNAYYVPTVTDLKSWLRATHTNTFNFWDTSGKLNFPTDKRFRDISFARTATRVRTKHGQNY